MIPGVAPDALHLAAFIGAVATLFVGHLLRAIRWRAILRNGHISLSNFSPLAALSMGYVANAVLPFRLGEGVRALTLAYMAKTDFLYVVATIIFERLLDLVVVGVGYMIFINYQDGTAELLSVQSAIALGVIACALLVLHAPPVRTILWRVASIFNASIKTSILHFLWSWAEITVRSGIVRKPSFWLLTTGMWLAYALSLVLMATAIDQTLEHMFAALYASPLSSSFISLFSRVEADLLVPIAIYLFAPLVAVTIYYVLFKMKSVSRIDHVVRWITDPTRYVAPHDERSQPRFASVDQYAGFLDRKFRGGDSLIAEFETRAIGGTTVHRIFPGGSAAVTALVETDNSLRVRKFAAGNSADRLDVQLRWLSDHGQSLPVVGLLGSGVVDGGIYYDMVYSGGSRDLYEAVHSEPIDTSVSLLSDVVGAFATFHGSHALADASDDTVRGYVAKKVCANLALIQDAFPEFFAQDSILVNGRRFNNKVWQVFATPDWMTKRLTIRRQARVHGDLTVENILIGKTGGWYLIDPNPENGFESPFIDFAKLMQSLHLGYESLNRDARATFVDGRLQVHVHRSQQYHELHAHVVRLLVERYGEDGLRQILLHELVNYFRLIPYQFRRSHTRGVAFVGALCLLLQDYSDRYPGDLPC